MMKNKSKSCAICEDICEKDTILTATSDKQLIDSTHEETVDSSYGWIIFDVDSNCEIYIKQMEQNNAALKNKLSFKDDTLAWLKEHTQKTRTIIKTQIDSIPYKVPVINPINDQLKKENIENHYSIKKKNKWIWILVSIIVGLVGLHVLRWKFQI